MKWYYFSLWVALLTVCTPCLSIDAPVPSTKPMFENEFTFAADYYASLQGDTLRIGNSLMERIFIWNNGNLKTYALLDKANRQQWITDKQEVDFVVPQLQNQTGAGSFSKQIVPANGVTPEHLEVTVQYQMDSLMIRRCYRVFAACPVISCQTYIKGDASGLSEITTETQGNAMSYENRIAARQFIDKTVILDRFTLPGRHWKQHAVEIFDISDHNNTLVQELPSYAYNGNFYRGNLFFTHDRERNAGLFLIKEAPTPTVQLVYPGADFFTDFGCIHVIGAGVTGRNLSMDKNEWIRLYGSAVGVYAGDELNRLVALRNYMKQTRLLKAKSEEMVMMNTWGDRAMGKNINEAFCLQEIACAARLGVTHFQIDYGWSYGDNVSKNPDCWRPDSVKFPRGLKPLIDAGQKVGVEVCLWYNPSMQDQFADWEKDAAALIELYRNEGVRVFKIDGFNISDKLSDIRFRMMLERLMEATNHEASINMDVTAGKRGGYFYLNEYGNFFMENRYTDYTNYVPFWTLRNLWMLSKYVPAEKIQVEFLNKWRHQEKYGTSKFAPEKYSFEYLFAITMAGQPLAWMNGTGLPEEAFAIRPLVDAYKKIQYEFHSGIILPVGYEPSGESWTGFQSMNGREGFLLIFREDNQNAQCAFPVYLKPGATIDLVPVFNGRGNKQRVRVDRKGTIPVTINRPNDFVMYRYSIQ